MRLSMYMLNDWLSKYHPIPKIESGKPVLRGARILSNDIRIERQNVYLAPAREFISGEGDKVICVHGHDIILLDTTDMDSVLNDIFEAFDYYNGWSDGLEDDIAEGCTLQQLVESSQEVLGFPIAVFDSGHLFIAHSTNYPRGSLDEQWDILLETRSLSLDVLKKLKKHLHASKFSHGVTRLDFPFFDTASYQRMLFHDNNVIGRIILLEAGGEISLGKQQLLNTFGDIMEHWMQQSRENQVLREEASLFRDLLDDQPVSHKELTYKLHMVGWEPEHAKQLASLHIPADSADLTYPILYRMEHAFESSYVFLHRQSIYVLINLEFTPVGQLQQMMQDILASNHMYCAFSYPFTDIFAVPLFAQQCTLTLQFCPKEAGCIYYCEDYALDYIHSILHTHVSPSVIHPAWAILRENDEKYGNDLCTTLYIYLRSNCNITETARILHLHRNSLMYRMNKIRALANVELDDGDVREYLLLSYYV